MPRNSRLYGYKLAGAARYRGTQIDQKGRAGCFPDRKIAFVVSGISKATPAKACAQRGSLGAAFEILGLIRCDNFVKQADMIGNGICDGVVGCGGQYQMTAVTLFLCQIVQQRLVVGQQSRIERCIGGDAVFESRAPTQEQCRDGVEQTSVAWVGSYAFQQGVGIGQRSIEINA